MLFWEYVDRKRTAGRRWFFPASFAFVVGFIGLSVALGPDRFPTAAIAAAVPYVVYHVWLVVRLLGMRCPVCGNPAFDMGSFVTGYSRCESCGLRRPDSSKRSGSPTELE